MIVSGEYADAWKECLQKYLDNKTWENFKTLFLMGYQDNYDQTKLTSRKSYSHSAHDAVDISIALNNLGMTDTAEKEIALKMTTDNDELMKVVKTLTY